MLDRRLLVADQVLFEFGSKLVTQRSALCFQVIIAPSWLCSFLALQVPIIKEGLKLSMMSLLAFFVPRPSICILVESCAALLEG